MTELNIKHLIDKRVLVTGGGGFLGKAIINQLLVYTPHIRSLSRKYYPELEKLNVQQVQGDIAIADIVDKACQDQDIVFHVAAKAGFWGPYGEYYQANVTGTDNIINACVKHKIGYLIYTSTPGVVNGGKEPIEGVDESSPYPDSFPTAYLATKALAEQAVMTSASDTLKTISLRPHLIWGPGENHLVSRIMAWAGKIVRVGDGKNLVDTVYIDNAAEAHLQAAEAIQKNSALSGNVYFISQGEPVYMWDIINAILKAGDKPPVSRSIPRIPATIIGALLEWVYKSLRLKSEPKLTRYLAHEFSSAQWFDISAARRDLGYAPQVSMEEGLKRLTEWMKTCN